MSTAEPHAAQVTDGREDAPRILLYSDDVDTRQEVLLAVGRRLRRGAPEILWTEVATPTAVVAEAGTGAYDLLVLDGEAGKAGGMGVSRQLKDEVFRCPPVLLLTGRPQDAWLASWSNADAVLSRPLDPIELQRVVAEILEARTTAG
jgi:DNA-binding response OmpR family regulator